MNAKRGGSAGKKRESKRGWEAGKKTWSPGGGGRLGKLEVSYGRARAPCAGKHAIPQHKSQTLRFSLFIAGKNCPPVSSML